NNHLCRRKNRIVQPESLNVGYQRIILGQAPSSVGYLSECFQHYGAALPSTLAMAERTVVFYLSDEIFARPQPILVTIEAHSTAILKIQLASDRSAETWKAHFDDLGEHRFHSIGM